MNASRHRPAALRGLGLFVLSLPLTVALAQSLPQLEPVVVTATRLEQPGKTCAVTMALTYPSTLVAFTKPGYAEWLRFTKYTKTNECDVGSCALIDCLPGTKCVEVAGEAECQPLPGSCGTMKCTAGTHCQDDASGKGSCIPDLGCASVLCAPGSFCAEDQGFAECKPYSTCANVKCTSTTTCVDLPIQCIKAPCAPTAPQCVPGTFSCPTQKYVNCMPPTTNPACSNPEKTWIEAHCPGVQYVY